MHMRYSQCPAPWLRYSLSALLSRSQYIALTSVRCTNLRDVRLYQLTQRIGCSALRWSVDTAKRRANWMQRTEVRAMYSLTHPALLAHLVST